MKKYFLTIIVISSIIGKSQKSPAEKFIREQSSKIEDFNIHINNAIVDAQNNMIREQNLRTEQFVNKYYDQDPKKIKNSPFFDKLPQGRQDRVNADIMTRQTAQTNNSLFIVEQPYNSHTIQKNKPNYQNQANLPFIGTKEFNFANGGSCCNVSIRIDRNGNCRIYSGMEGTLTYYGKFKPIMNGIKIYKQNGKLYAAMVNSKGTVKKDCIDINGNFIKCIFQLY